MAYDKVIDSTLLDAGMTATADAIRAKTGSVFSIEWNEETGFKAAIEEIDTESGVELPELNNQVEDSEVFLGKEYIDGDGQKKTGSFTIDDELMEQDSLISQITTALRNKAAGSLITLPELGDTAAQPTDMVLGKVLYDDQGNPVIGTVKETTANYATYIQASYVYENEGQIDAYGVIDEDVLLRNGAVVHMLSQYNDYGGAELGDVAKGVTFTSKLGLRVQGTHECEKGVQMYVDGDTLYITGDVTVKNETLIL